ncbi:MAG: serine protease [Desulfobia sp.]
MVKIYTVYNRYSYHNPWQHKGQQIFHGSGCIISGQRILTSAHVVSDQVFIQVRRGGEADKYPAEIAEVAHECDLAILKVKDEKIFEGVTPLEIGALPHIRDRVTVYGFPDGGDRLSLSEGVVSRIEHTEYAHSGAYLLACQIDAPINSGNSGGPVIKKGKIAGIAFQGMNSSRYENIGYMVPAPIIRHFLKDMEDGRHDGTPSLGLSMQKMENPDLRSHYKMKKNHTGALVNKIYPGSPCEGILRENDIIIAIEGQQVGNDGTVELRPGQRTYFGLLIQKKQVGENAGLTILRQGKIENVNIPVNKSINFDRLVPQEQFDMQPRFYIYCGLVFQPLTLNYLKEFDNGGNWANYSPIELLNYYLNKEPKTKDQEVVILSKVLADKSNTGYHDFSNRVIKSINGLKINKMADVVKAIENYNGKEHTIKDIHGFQIILDRRQGDRASPGILKKFQIPRARSRNL